MFFKIVHITWVDSETDQGWDGDFEGVDDHSLIHTVGFLAHESEKFVVVANSLDHANEHYNGRIKIPKCCIAKRRVITKIKVD